MIIKPKNPVLYCIGLYFLTVKGFGRSTYKSKVQSSVILHKVDRKCDQDVILILKLDQENQVCFVFLFIDWAKRYSIKYLCGKKKKYRTTKATKSQMSNKWQLNTQYSHKGWTSSKVFINKITLKAQWNDQSMCYGCDILLSYCPK